LTERAGAQADADASRERPPVDLRALFPAHVFHHALAIDLEAPGDPRARFPEIPLPDELARAVPKRRAEFLAGRHCARRAIAAAAPELAHASVPVGPNRAPQWPAELVGAITHTQGVAAAAVARRALARGVGLDAEVWMRADRAAPLADALATARELDGLERATGWARAEVLTLVFSAKETVFKCLYPEVGRYFGFHDAEVRAVDAAAGTFVAALCATLTPALERGLVLRGRFARSDVHVCTAMVLEA
jgi:enterobactin synthetase component D